MPWSHKVQCACPCRTQLLPMPMRCKSDIAHKTIKNSDHADKNSQFSEQCWEKAAKKRETGDLPSHFFTLAGSFHTFHWVTLYAVKLCLLLLNHVIAQRWLSWEYMPIPHVQADVCRHTLADQTTKCDHQASFLKLFSLIQCFWGCGTLQRQYRIC